MTIPHSPNDENDAQLVAASIRDRCGPIGTWSKPPGYPDSLALSIIDAIQSVGVKYGSVVNVIGHYRDHRGPEVANHDGAVELVGVFDRLGVEGFQTLVHNHHRVSTQPAALSKAEAIRQAAHLLARHAPTTSDLRARATDQELQQQWRALPGQRSGNTWRYLLMLAGVPGVKPDRMVRRFVARAVQRPGRSLSDDDLARLVTLAAYQLGIHPTLADHLIWRAQSGRKPRMAPTPDPGEPLTTGVLRGEAARQRVNVEASLKTVSTRTTAAGQEWAQLEMDTPVGDLPVAASPIIWARHRSDLVDGRTLLIGDLVTNSDGRTGLWLRNALSTPPEL